MNPRSIRLVATGACIALLAACGSSSTTAPEGPGSEPLPITVIASSGWTPADDGTLVASNARPMELVTACAEWLHGEDSGPHGITQAHATTGPAGTSVTFIGRDGDVVSCDASGVDAWCSSGGWGHVEPPSADVCVDGSAFLYAPTISGAAWVISDDGRHRIAYPTTPALPGARIHATPEGTDGAASTTVTWLDADGNVLSGPTLVRGEARPPASARSAPTTEPLPLLYTLIRPTGWTPNDDATWPATAMEPEPLVASCARHHGVEATGPAHATYGLLGISVTFVAGDGIGSCDSTDLETWCGGGGWWSDEPPFDGLAASGASLSYCFGFTTQAFMYAIGPEGAAWVISDDGTNRVGYPTVPELPARIHAATDDTSGGATTTVTWLDQDGNVLEGPTLIHGYVAG